MAKKEPAIKDSYTRIEALLTTNNMADFYVNDLEFDNFLKNGLVSNGPGPWFMHCKDKDGRQIFVDFTKIVYFLAHPKEEESN